MIPARYEKASYENDVPEDIKLLMREMSKTKKGLYIHGTVGTGKTHIAYAIKDKWDKPGYQMAHFWNTTELFQEIRDDYDRHVEAKKNRFADLMDSEALLFLDDVGSEKPSEWVQEQFYLLINKRYNEMRPIIFTSNYSISELAARLGDRTVSRIVEMSHVVKLDGKDRRLPE